MGDIPIKRTESYSGLCIGGPLDGQTLTSRKKQMIQPFQDGQWHQPGGPDRPAYGTYVYEWRDYDAIKVWISPKEPAPTVETKAIKDSLTELQIAVAGKHGRIFELEGELERLQSAHDATAEAFEIAKRMIDEARVALKKYGHDERSLGWTLAAAIGQAIQHERKAADELHNELAAARREINHHGYEFSEILHPLDKLVDMAIDTERERADARVYKILQRLRVELLYPSEFLPDERPAGFNEAAAFDRILQTIADRTMEVRKAPAEEALISHEASPIVQLIGIFALLKEAGYYDEKMTLAGNVQHIVGLLQAWKGTDRTRAGTLNKIGRAVGITMPLYEGELNDHVDRMERVILDRIGAIQDVNEKVFASVRAPLETTIAKARDAADHLVALLGSDND